MAHKRGSPRRTRSSGSMRHLRRLYAASTGCSAGPEPLGPSSLLAISSSASVSSSSIFLWIASSCAAVERRHGHPKDGIIHCPGEDTGCGDLLWGVLGIDYAPQPGENGKEQKKKWQRRNLPRRHSSFLIFPQNMVSGFNIINLDPTMPKNM